MNKISKFGDIPIIIAGDLNSDKLDNYKNTSLEELVNNDFYELPLAENEITYHFCHKSIFDYIFVKNVTSSSYVNSGVSFSQSKISPNNIQPSDHFPINCILNL